ncbi:ABC transporter ATP-binding protein [Boudabousia tangfeifanii]|uniref:ABC transporter ATP-binding protein n=1 Tax=Boudabousia tangfeifanii TaxID=1912795 RepID=UPI0009F2ED53
MNIPSRSSNRQSHRAEPAAAAAPQTTAPAPAAGQQANAAQVAAAPTSASQPTVQQANAPVPSPTAPTSAKQPGNPQDPTSARPTDQRPLALHATNLHKTYGKGEAKVEALKGVSVSIPVGQFTAILGPSGSGKSTLMHALAGLDTIDSGSIQLAGTELTALKDDQLTRLRAEKIGFVFQAFNLVPTLSAEQNILLPLQLAKQSPDQAWVDGIIDLLGLRDRLSHRPAQMSGGQQQRVALARALASKPALIVADEPTGNLDTKTSAEVLKVLRSCVDELGQTVLMVTHDLHAAALADRALVLRDGQIVADLAHPAETQLQGLI